MAHVERIAAGLVNQTATMKICVLGTRGFPHIQGGVERHCECLYPRMAAMSDVHITVFRRKPYVSETPDVPFIRFIDLPSTRLKGIEALVHSFLATCYTIFLHPDVAHVHNIGPAFFSPLLRLFGIPVVLTFHSPNYEHSKWGKLGKAFLRLSERLAFAAATSIIFVQAAQREKTAPDIRAKSACIPNGIEPPPALDAEPLPPFQLAPQRYVLAVGRITPEKGFDDLIQAYPTISDIPLVIAGGSDSEPDYFERLKKLAKGKNIRFVGSVMGNRLYRLYRHARLFVLPSHNEGFPLVLLEAMSFSLDILASDIPANRALHLTNEHYVPCRNIPALAKAIQQHLQGPVHSFDYDLSGYRWERICKETLGVLRKASRHPPEKSDY